MLGQISGEGLTKTTETKTPAPTLEEYWRRRYPKYQFSNHIAYMISALEDLQPGEALVLCVPPRHSKCQPSGSPILMADGSIKAIEHICTGDVVVSVTKGYTFGMAPVDDVIDNGIKEVVRVHLDSGRFIDCTLNHPLLTIEGYVEAGSLREGKHIGVVRQTPNFKGAALPIGYPALLGYLAGDGSTGQGHAIVTSTDPDVIADLYRLAEMHNWKITRDGDITYHFRRVSNKSPLDSAPGPMLRLFAEGIFGCKAPEKRVPQSIFKAPNEQVAEFLAAYFDCDGHVAHCRGGYAEICSASEGLLRDVQMLFTRLGILTDLRVHPQLYKGEQRVYWKLLARGSELQRFSQAIPLKGEKRLKLAKVIEDNRYKRRFPVQESIPPGWQHFIKRDHHYFRKIHNIRFDKTYKQGTARHIVERVAELDDNDYLRKLCSPHLLWERITKIESLGAVQTHGLSVSHDHVYISGDVISHNTESVKAWLEWWLGQEPESDALYASYGVDLARRSSRAIRNELLYGTCLKSFYPNTKLSSDSQGVTDWALEQGGQFRAAGVGGGLTGMGAKFAVIDDPFKDRREADSSLRQNTVWEWFTQVFLTRLTPDARVVVMHTRWADGDLAGRIKTALKNGETDDLGGLKWRILELKGLAEEDDELGRASGAALWPERYTRKKLLGIQKADPYGFAALYQQHPRPRTDRVFGPASYYTETPSVLRHGRGADLAYTKDTRADFSAVYQVGEHLVKTGSGIEPFYYVLYGDRWQEEIGQSITRLRAVQSRYGGSVRIEANGPQKGIAGTLEIAKIAIDRFQPVGDKYARALPLIEAWNAGRVLLPSPEQYPQHREWVEALVNVFQSFTGSGSGERDDDVDALGNAVVQLQEIRLSTTDPNAVLAALHAALKRR